MGHVFGGDGGELERTGFAGLLADIDEQESPPAESPTSWAPAGISHGPADEDNRLALEAFHEWLADRRDAERP